MPWVFPLRASLPAARDDARVLRLRRRPDRAQAARPALYALAYVVFWLGVTALLYRHRVVIKI